MRLHFLTDTHILIWALNQPEMIPADIKSIIQDDDNAIYYSPLSLWEIAIKFSLGKLDLLGHTPEEFYKELANSFFACKPLQNDTLVSSYALPWYHRDPFDRMLIWEAIKSNMVLLSSDAIAEKYAEAGLRLIQ